MGRLRLPVKSIKMPLGEAFPAALTRSPQFASLFFWVFFFPFGTMPGKTRDHVVPGSEPGVPARKGHAPGLCQLLG